MLNPKILHLYHLIHEWVMVKRLWAESSDDELSSRISMLERRIFALHDSIEQELHTRRHTTDPLSNQ